MDDADFVAADEEVESHDDYDDLFYSAISNQPKSKPNTTGAIFLSLAACILAWLLMFNPTSPAVDLERSQVLRDSAHHVSSGTEDYEAIFSSLKGQVSSFGNCDVDDLYKMGMEIIVEPNGEIIDVRTSTMKRTTSDCIKNKVKTMNVKREGNDRVHVKVSMNLMAG